MLVVSKSSRSPIRPTMRGAAKSSEVLRRCVQQISGCPSVFCCVVSRLARIVACSAGVVCRIAARIAKRPVPLHLDRETDFAFVSGQLPHVDLGCSPAQDLRSPCFDFGCFAVVTQFHGDDQTFELGLFILHYVGDGHQCLVRLDVGINQQPLCPAKRFAR